MSYLINEQDTFKVSIDIDISKKRPKAIFTPTQKALLKPDQIKIETAQFYYLNYGVDSRIRSESRTSLPGGNTGIDLTKYEENRLRYLLKEWSLSKTNEELTLERTEGRLTDKSLDSVCRVDPTIVQAFLNKASIVWDLGEDEEENFTNTAPLS